MSVYEQTMQFLVSVNGMLKNWCCLNGSLKQRSATSDLYKSYI